MATQYEDLIPIAAAREMIAAAAAESAVLGFGHTIQIFASPALLLKCRAHSKEKSPKGRRRVDQA